MISEVCQWLKANACFLFSMWFVVVDHMAVFPTLGMVVPLILLL